MIQTNKKISLNIVKRHSGLKIKSKCLYFEVRKVDLGLNLALFCTGSALTFLFYLSTSNRNGLNPGSAPSQKNIFKAHVIFIIIMSFTEDNRDLVDWICDSLKKNKMWNLHTAVSQLLYSDTKANNTQPEQINCKRNVANIEQLSVKEHTWYFSWFPFFFCGSQGTSQTSLIETYTQNKLSGSLVVYTVARKVKEPQFDA